MDVVGRHAGAGSDRIQRSELLERKRHLLGGVEERDALAHGGVHGGRARAERERPAQVDGLRRDGQLDRDDACAEIEHLGDTPRAERRQGGPVLDARLLHRRRELERDRRGEQARLGRDRLSRDAELGETVLPRALGRDEPLAQAAEPRAQELQRPLDRRGEHRRERDAQEVERGGQRLRVEVADGDDPRLAGDDERVSLVRVELDRRAAARRTAARRARRRAAGGRSGTSADPAGSGRHPAPRARFRGAAGACARSSRRFRDRASRRRSRRAALRCLPGRLRSRARPRRRSIRRARARRRPRAMPARSSTRCSRGARVPRRLRARARRGRRRARSAFCARSAWPTVPSECTSGATPRLSTPTIASATSGRTPWCPATSPFASRSSAARTTSSGAERAEPDEMAEDRRAVERSQLGRVHGCVPPHPDTGRDAVCGRSCRRRLLDDRAPLAHARERFGCERDALA